MLNPQQIADMMTTAFEGGSNYWLNQADPSPHAYRIWYAEPDFWTNANLSVELRTEDGVETLEFDDLLIGFNGLLLYRPQFDFDNHDAEDADIFLQCATFGDIVYG